MSNDSDRLSPTERILGSATAAVVAAFVAMFLGSLALSKVNGASSRVKAGVALGAGLLAGIFLGRRYGAAGWGIAAGLGGLGMTALFAEFAGAVNAGEAFGFEKGKDAPRLRSA
jgi:hypothetical protein